MVVHGPCDGQEGTVAALRMRAALGYPPDVVDMSAGLRQNAQQICKEAERRGKPNLFSSDQATFN